MRVLIVGDRGSAVEDLARGLRASGHDVAIAPDEAADGDLALSPETGIVLLSRHLAGSEWAVTLATIKRVRPALPVIVLSDECDADARVEGLDLGASDYLSRPFSLGELAARIRARLRESAVASESVLAAGDIRLNQITREALRSEQVVLLPQRECDLLAYLMQRAGEVCTRREILTAVWTYNHDPETNVVQVYVGYLRRRLSFPGRPLPVETVRSMGYRLNIDA
jgi:DNA-binding response OmpR family regulator